MGAGAGGLGARDGLLGERGGIGVVERDGLVRGGLLVLDDGEDGVDLLDGVLELGGGLVSVLYR